MKKMFKTSFLLSLLALSSCKGIESPLSMPSIKPIEDITLKLATPYIRSTYRHDDRGDFFAKINAYAESIQDYSRYHFTFVYSEEDECDLIYKTIHHDDPVTNVKELPSQIKEEL